MLHSQTLCSLLASLVDAYHRCCLHTANEAQREWASRHAQTVAQLTDLLPHGSGLDGVVLCEIALSTEDKLVITAEYHHMNENGYYDGWATYTLTVRPSLAHGFTVHASGGSREARRYAADTREYLAEIFEAALRQHVAFDRATGTYTLASEE